MLHNKWIVNRYEEPGITVYPGITVLLVAHIHNNHKPYQTTQHLVIPGTMSERNLVVAKDNAYIKTYKS